MPDAGTLALLIPITIFMIPIIAILTAHQRAMAEIMHSRKGEPSEIAALRQEVMELKQLLHQQAIAIDNLSTRQIPEADVQRRLGR